MGTTNLPSRGDSELMDAAVTLSGEHIRSPAGTRIRPPRACAAPASCGAHGNTLHRAQLSVTDPRQESGNEPADDGHDVNARYGRAPAAGTSRWVKVAAVLAAIALLALFIVLHLTGTLGAGTHQ